MLPSRRDLDAVRLPVSHPIACCEVSKSLEPRSGHPSPARLSLFFAYVGASANVRRASRTPIPGVHCYRSPCLFCHSRGVQVFMWLVDAEVMMRYGLQSIFSSFASCSTSTNHLSSPETRVRNDGFFLVLVTVRLSIFSPRLLLKPRVRDARSCRCRIDSLSQNSRGPQVETAERSRHVFIAKLVGVSTLECFVARNSRERTWRLICTVGY